MTPPRSAPFDRAQGRLQTRRISGNYYVSISLLRALRDLRGEISVSILVATVGTIYTGGTL
jgi:hypothetical protein